MSFWSSLQQAISNYINVDINYIQLVKLGTAQTITISSNVSGTISKSQTWINISKTTFANNDNFTISATDNTTGQWRIGTVTLTNGTEITYIDVEQDFQ